MEAGDGGFHDFAAHPLHGRFVIAEPRTQAPHPPRVRPFVVFEAPLVVLGGTAGDRAGPVADRKDAQFGAREALLDDDRLSGLAEAAFEQPCGVPGGGIEIAGEEHALAGGEPARLDYRRFAVFPGPKRPLRRLSVPDHGVAGRRNPVAAHEVLGELLGGLEEGGVLPRPEARNVALRQPVGQTRRERSLRSGDHQVHAFSGREVGQPADVLRPHRGETRHSADARIPGRRDQLVELGTPRDSPRQRVFASAAADQKDPHRGARRPTAYDADACGLACVLRPAWRAACRRASHRTSGA